MLVALLLELLLLLLEHVLVLLLACRGRRTAWLPSKLRMHPPPAGGPLAVLRRRHERSRRGQGRRMTR